MTTLALSALIDSAPRWLSRLLRYWTEFSSGIEEARRWRCATKSFPHCPIVNSRHAGSGARTFHAAYLVYSKAFDCCCNSQRCFRFHALQAGRPLL
jgi:hypothetical protein